MRKAEVEISFNWIFILLVGAAFLFFFFNIINWQIDDGEQTTQRTISARLGPIFDALQSNPETVKVHDRVAFEVDFRCDLDTGHEYQLVNSNQIVQLPYQLFFTPERIGGSRLISLVKKFSVPYDIDSLLLLTDERTEYVFLGSDNTITRFYNLLPDEFVKRQINSINDYRAQDFRHTIFISSSELENLPQRSSNVVLQNNNVKINGEEFRRVNDALTLAAIVSGDEKNFKCTFDKLIKKTEIINDILINRSNTLGQHYVDIGNSVCASLYQPEIVSNRINDVITNNNQFNNQRIQDIAQANSNLRRQSCITIY